MYEDITLKCKDCGCDFVWTAGEQEFYAEKGFTNQPSRCKDCRSNKKSARRSGHREMAEAVCAKCGKTCQVPASVATDGRPVLCSDCFAEEHGRR